MHSEVPHEYNFYLLSFIFSLCYPALPCELCDRTNSNKPPSLSPQNLPDEKKFCEAVRLHVYL